MINCYSVHFIKLIVMTFVYNMLLQSLDFSSKTTSKMTWVQRNGDQMYVIYVNLGPLLVYFA